MNANASLTSIQHGMQIGWSQQDITPSEPVLLSGQFHARVSEGVKDPISVTALAMDTGSDHVVFIACDLVGLSDEVMNLIRQKSASAEGLDVSKIIIHVTHTHTAPEVRLPKVGQGNTTGDLGVELKVMAVADYVAFFTDRAAQAVREAWASRKPGKVAYGLTHAVIGRNRRWVNLQGESRMYGDTSQPSFSHIEGYEDHTINVLATYDERDHLTGVVVNMACPSQETEGLFQVSADFWCETRIELRQRLGDKLYILPQCSAAGDLSPHPIWGRKAENRMLALKGRTSRQEIAHRLACAVEDVLPAIKPTASGNLTLTHQVVHLSLPLNAITQAMADEYTALAAASMELYEAEKKKTQDPKIREENPRWYVPVTAAIRRSFWQRDVPARFEQLKTQTSYDAQVHILRLGDMVLATNPFEYYLDFGLRIKARSPAEQTILLQLAGNGTYVPSPRSVAGGGYGSVPASNVVGAEGGRILCEKTLELINALWA